MRAVWSVVEDLGRPAGATLVMKSTVPVGTGERIRAELGPEVGYVSNPEFLSEGRAIEDFVHPDRIVIGSFDEEHGDRVAALYEGFEAPIVRTSVASAEMIKLASNAFLATRISFSTRSRTSPRRSARTSTRSRRHGPRQANRHGLPASGIGYGGSCFPKDVSFLKLLAGNSGYHFQLVSAVIEVNELQKRVVDKLRGPGSASCGARRSRSSGSRSSRTRTTCARRRRSCSPTCCVRRGPRLRAAYRPANPPPTTTTRCGWRGTSPDGPMTRF